MQCDYCNNKATVFFTQIIDGNSKKSCLCEACATQSGVIDPDGFLLGNIEASANPTSPTNPKDSPFDPPLTGDTTDPATHTPPTLEKSATCPGCGFALDDLKKTGRLGCSQCYQSFHNEIRHNLGGMHKGTSHTGRVPEGMLKAFQQRQHREQLQQEMDEAIQAEDYEKAAALRDQLSQLSEIDPGDNLTLEP
ncbi:MAG: UvrB/UvrC motif-containing protein [Verrucomicrobiae bacterium]|nr:UvrB/UvrC motif-containing protein [Verrucomicrobiae bacterium]NNJ42760.1 excinuclease ABC subunit B [Akkermansiaceae bacterium]